MVKFISLDCFFETHKTRPALLASFLFLRTLVLGFVIVTSLFNTACSSENTRTSLRFSGETMGTHYHITLVADGDQVLPVAQVKIQQLVDDELKKINQHMSTYIADSELMLLNAAEVDEWHSISKPLQDVLQLSQHISQQSNGAFDITVGPLVNLWGFGPDKHEDEVPAVDVIETLKSSIGYQKLELADGKARKLADIKLDLSAIAKGYGVDWIADLVEGQGVTNYMIEIGGEVRVSGVNPKGLPWRIAIEQPSLLHHEVRKAIAITGAGMATSGDYRNYFEKDGKRFSHTIDPLTGYPIAHKLASVTVIAKTAAEADAWATAINVLGPERGMEIANQEELAVYMIIKEDKGEAEFSDRYSTAFALYQ